MNRLFYFFMLCLLLTPATSFIASADSVTIYIFNPITSYRVLPDTSIPSVYISNQISVVTCPGEFVPATFVLKPNFQATITFEVQGFSWPTDSIDIRVVKCWQQRGDGIVPDYPTISELLPELVLKDDTLVYVQNSEDYVRINGAYTQVSHTNGVYGRNTQVTIMDTTTLQPVTIPANTNKQFWVTIHPPSNAVDGNYTGSILIKNNGVTIATISLTVTVLPFTLPDSTVETSIYESQWYSSSQPNGSLRHRRSLQQLNEDFTNLKNHGITNLTMYESFNSNSANFGLFMQKRNKVYGNPVTVYYLGEGSAFLMSSHGLAGYYVYGTLENYLFRDYKTEIKMDTLDDYI